MGVFKRVKEIVAADLHRMLDKCEDPVSMAQLYLRQIEERIEKTNEALAGQLAAEQETASLLDHMAQIVAKRLRQAELAVDREEERIAEIAIADKLQHEKLMEGYARNLDSIQVNIGALKQEIVRLKELHRELRERLYFLASRARAARAIEGAASFPAYRTDKVMRGFERLEQNVRRLEAGASAKRWAAAPHQGELDRIDRNEEIQAELKRIKDARGKKQTG
ncbi:PspA/IM30 family protein [Paenibacillus arenilitoris]|uniref:PspA/IM30 family protein n=1 Tax=Paenibacillus arenilitoris TaxID=2772299 RepID=A0A927CQD2_9BACL|nr:PspA/IM30 family protein [Paenibacillus arenilitoris]MBD2870011.1 PspA/IM30 family protein [Paenibacillus arenilitoris]